MGKVEEPKLVSTSGATGDKYTHPAFGVIRASRIQCHGQTLFDSNLKHNGYISIVIEEASLHRSKGYHHIHGNKRLIELKMSESQWAHFVSSLNMGSGSPVTLGIVGNEVKPDIAPEKVKERFKLEFEDIQKDHKGRMDALLNTVKDLTASKRIPKGAGNDMISQIEMARNYIGSNASFMAKCFSEHMEETVDSGKAEIEAHAIKVFSTLPASESQSLSEGQDIVNLQITDGEDGDNAPE